MAAKENGNEAELKALEAFVVENPELEQLEALLSRFNLFEAIGATRVEVRHSDFLAFLLDPSQNHGLGDFVLKRLLQKILAETGSGSGGIRPVDLALMDLSNTSVRREWEHTDILCVNDDNRLVVLIENKIDSGEGRDQLLNYLRVVQRAYPEYKTLPLFLTPEGTEPLDDGSPFISVSYSWVCDTLDYLLEARKSVMGAEVFTTITHYVEMLRRHIVSDSPIADLARKIYAKHHQALDLIFEHRPDQQLEWREILEKMVRAEPALILDHCSKAYIRFVPKEWADVPDLNKGEGWTPTKRILLFQFNNFPPDRLRLGLYIGPSVADAEGIRRQLFHASQADRNLFRGATKTLARKWSTIWAQDFLTKKDFEASDGEDAKDLDEKVQEKWRSVVHDLPALVSAVKEVFGR